MQKACGRLLSERWIKQSDNNLVSFLAQFDVVSNPTVAEHAIKAFLAGNPRFTPPNDDSIWQDLLPEVALILAVYCEQAAASGNQEAIDTLIPEVSAQVNRIEKYFKLSIAGTDPESSMSEEEAEMTKIGYDFVLTQLLRIAMVLDYGDEVGRRNMFASLRRMLSSSMLDEIHLTSIVDVMRKTAFDERDFARIVVEIITDMISESDPPSASQEATEADDISGAERYIMKMNAISRCLEIIRCVLEKLDGDLNSLPSLVGLLNELVLPATKIGDETLLSIQHRSLYCLALFCLLDRSLAVDHYSTFRDTFAAAASMDIRTLCLRSMFDLVCLYGATTMGRGNSPDALKPLLDALEYPSEVINSIAVQGVSKLALLGQVDDEKVNGATCNSCKYF